MWRGEQLAGWLAGLRDLGKSSTKPGFWLEYFVNNDSSHSDKTPKEPANELDCGPLWLKELVEHRKISGVNKGTSARDMGLGVVST